MTAENKPTFRTQAVEFIKGLGLLVQMALDLRTDPFFVELMRQKDPATGKPETLAERLRRAVGTLR